MNRRGTSSGLVFASLSAGIVSALGILLVPSIARAYDVSVAGAQWMLTVSLLAGVIATPIMGRLSDGRRKRTVLVVSILIIGVGSVVCAVAPTFGLFLAGRVLQGLSYGIYPVAASVARRELTGPTVRSTVSGLAVSGAIGTGLGYPISGALAELGSFRLAYVFGAAFMAAAVVVIMRVVRKDPARGGEVVAPFDVWGALLLGSGLAPLLFWIAEGPRIGWTSLLSVGLVGASILLLAGWVWRALAAGHPLVDVRSLVIPDVMIANLVALAFGVTLYVVCSGSGLVGQAPADTGYGYGWGVAIAGFVMIPLTIGTSLANRLAGRFATEHAILWVLPIAAGIEVVASVLLVFFSANVVGFYAGMLLAGAGLGAVQAALPLMIGRRVPASDFGSAVSFNQVVRTAGGAVGSAVTGAVILATSNGTGFPSRAGIEFNFAVPGAISLVAGLTVLAVAIWRR